MRFRSARSNQRRDQAIARKGIAEAHLIACIPRDDVPQPSGRGAFPCAERGKIGRSTTANSTRYFVNVRIG